MSITKRNKSKIPADRILNQSDYSVYAVKILDEQRGYYEGRYKTIYMVLLDNNWTPDSSAYPMMVAKSYLDSSYNNSKYWNKIVEQLEDDVAVKLESVEFEIYIKDFATNSEDLLIDADTPFQIKRTFLLDDHNHHEVFSLFDNLDKVWLHSNNGDDNIIDLNAFVKANT